MGSLIVRACNALRQPLPDTMDVRLLRAGDNSVVKEALGVSGAVDVVMKKLVDHQPYIVQVHSQRHRPVQQFAVPKPSGAVIVQVYCPLDPKRARAGFPSYPLEIPSDLRSVLHQSPVDYADLGAEQKAGLFNVYAKMAAVGVWQGVEHITAVQPDRILCDVRSSLLDDVAAAPDRFLLVSGALHDSPEGFKPFGSFKTLEAYGNLQLTFFKCYSPEVRFKLDADIDDAAGLTHVFHVIKHGLTNGKTHPYDIHEILTFSQALVLPYTLA